MPTLIRKIRALAGQAIELPALKFRDGVDKVTRSQTEGMLSQLTRGEKVTVRAVASFGARVFSGSDFEGWEQTRNFAPWQRATADGGDGRLLEFIAVSEGVKRDGSTIRVDGIDTTNLARNPVFLWVHNSDEAKPPIGRIVAMKKVDDLEAGRVLMIRVAPLATTDGTEHIDFARMIFNMFENGDMHAVSFGWVPTEYDVMHDAEGYFLGFDFLKSDALEVSAVPTPADPDALKKECTYRSAVSQYPDRFTTKREAGVFILRDGTELGPLFRATPEVTPEVTTEVETVADPVADPAVIEASDETTVSDEVADKLRGMFAGPVRDAIASKSPSDLFILATDTVRAGANGDAVFAAIDAEIAAAREETSQAEALRERLADLFGDKNQVERAGKVLSRKNRDSVQAAHDACVAATVTLRDLLDATNEATDDEGTTDDARLIDPLREAAAALAHAAGTDDQSVIDDVTRAAQRLAALVKPQVIAPTRNTNPYDVLYASAASLAALAGA